MPDTVLVILRTTLEVCPLTPKVQVRKLKQERLNNLPKVDFLTCLSLFSGLPKLMG